MVGGGLRVAGGEGPPGWRRSRGEALRHAQDATLTPGPFDKPFDKLRALLRMLPSPSQERAGRGGEERSAGGGNPYVRSAARGAHYDHDNTNKVDRPMVYVYGQQAPPALVEQAVDSGAEHIAQKVARDLRLFQPKR